MLLFQVTCSEINYFPDYLVQDFTLNKGAVEPLDVVAVRVQDENLITGDRHRE